MAEVARDRVRDGRDLMEQDIPDEHVDEFIENVRPWAHAGARTEAPKWSLTGRWLISMKTSGYWGDPSMFPDAPEYPNYQVTGEEPV